MIKFRRQILISKYKILKNSYHRSRIIEYAGSTNVKTTAKITTLQIVVTTVIGSATILKRTVMVFLSLNRQAALTKLISDNKKAKPCKSTLAIWLCISLMSIVSTLNPWPYFIKVDKFITIRGMEQIQACTIRKQFEIGFFPLELSWVENKFHKYPKRTVRDYQN